MKSKTRGRKPWAVVLMMSFLILTICSISACIPPKPQPGPYNPPPSNIIDLVGRLPHNASAEDLETRLDELIVAAMNITRRDMPLLRQAIKDLRSQPQVVNALYQKYLSIPGDFGRRKEIVAIIGELQLDDSLQVLSGIVWTPLPDVPDVSDGLSPRNYEEIIQMKAVEGIAFHRGDNDAITLYATKQMEDIMLSHPSQAVRRTAIDAYMWNHGDSAETASHLYSILPVDLHPYVEMPRFSSGANRKAFERRLNAWRAKWATQEQSHIQKEESK